MDTRLILVEPYDLMKKMYEVALSVIKNNINNNNNYNKQEGDLQQINDKTTNININNNDGIENKSTVINNINNKRKCQ